MPLLNLMTPNNPKMDWCNTLSFNYEHNVTFDYTFSWFNDYFATHKKVNESRSVAFYVTFIKYGMRLYGQLLERDI